MMRDHLDTLHEFWGRRHWLVKLAMVAVLVAATGALVGRPVYRLVVAWRCDRNLGRAGEALQDGRLNEARDLAFSVIQLRPGDLEAVRLASRAMQRLGDPRGGDAARFLFSHPAATNEDRRSGWATIAAEVPLGLVGHAWTTLDEAQRMDPGFLLPFVDRLLAERRVNDAAAACEPLDLDHTAVETERRVLEILLRSEVAAAHRAAQQRLLGRIESGAGDIERLLSLLDLVPQAELDQGLGDALGRWLEHRPQPAAEEALCAARFQVAAAPDDAAAGAIIAAAIARWREPAPAELAGWLLRIGRAAQALEVVPAERPQDVSLYRLSSQALADLGRWRELLEHLAECPRGLPRLEWFCDRAIAAAMCDESAKRAEAWANARGEAEVSAGGGGWLRLARLAKGGGLAEEHVEAMVEAIRFGHGPLPLYSDLLAVLKALREQGKARELLDIAAAYLSYEPWNPAVLTQYCYLSCLYSHVDAAFVSEVLEPCRQKLENALPIRCTIALAHLVAGDAPQALEASDASGVSWPGAAPEYRIIHGIALAANGRRTESDTILEGVDWGGLMPLERKVFTALLEGAQRNAGAGTTSK